MSDVRVRITYPDGRQKVEVAKSSDVFQTCGRTVVKIEKGFQIFPFGTKVEVFRA